LDGDSDLRKEGIDMGFVFENKSNFYTAFGEGFTFWVKLFLGRILFYTSLPLFPDEACFIMIGWFPSSYTFLYWGKIGDYLFFWLKIMGMDDKVGLFSKSNSISYVV